MLTSQESTKRPLEGEAPPQKRSRKTFDWCVSISTPQTFKTLLAIVQPTVAHVSFQVCRDETFTGLRMDAMNSSRVCMVKTAYECRVDTSTTLANATFCVETDTFMTLMRDVQASHVVELIRFTDSADLTIKTYERADSNNWSISTIQMVDDDVTDFKKLDMQTLEFNYVVEIELERLKEVCRIIHAIRGNVIELRVEEPAVQVGEEHHHYFTIAAENEGASTRKIHHSSTVPETTGPDAIRVVRGNQVGGDEEERDDLVERFSGTYPAMYLNGVLKSMDRQTVQLYLSPGLPLVLHYGLGNASSYIKIILAPRLTEA